jgi:Amt family ammonium transporter
MTAALPDTLQPSFILPFILPLFFILLAPLAIAGLSLINTGLGRSRSAAQFMTSSLMVLSTAAMVYFIFGFAFQGHPSSWTGDHGSLSPRGFFFSGVPWGSLGSLTVLLSTLSVALVAIIPLGASADRWRMGAACTSTVVAAGCVYPIFVRLISEFNSSAVSQAAGLPGIIDAGGSGSISVTGGVTALSVAWLLGPRRGKYSSSGMSAAIPAHNGVFVLFGCMLAWTGWLGLNAAGAILTAGIRPENSALIAINTTFSAAAASLAAAAVTRYRFRKPDASLIANGWMAGLVASSAGCAALKPATAVLTGLVAGALVVFSVEFLEFTLKIDDPCGSVSVHAVCGIWGLLATGMLAGAPGQLISQLIGISTLLGFILPMSYGLNWLLVRFVPYRVSLDGERQGLDLHELGADAYPEFVVHADEFMQR